MRDRVVRVVHPCDEIFHFGGSSAIKLLRIEGGMICRMRRVVLHTLVLKVDLNFLSKSKRTLICFSLPAAKD